MKYFLNTNYQHNLDDLKNIIKEICARANIESSSILYIGVNHLPERLTNTGNSITEKEVRIGTEWINVNDYTQPDASESIINLFDSIIKEFNQDEANIHACVRNSSLLLNKFYDDYIIPPSLYDDISVKT